MIMTAPGRRGATPRPAFPLGQLQSPGPLTPPEQRRRRCSRAHRAFQEASPVPRRGRAATCGAGRSEEELRPGQGRLTGQDVTPGRGVQVVGPEVDELFLAELARRDVTPQRATRCEGSHADEQAGEEVVVDLPII